MHSKSRLILNLCQHLENDGITYVIVGDTRRYPDESFGDTDILIDMPSLSSAKRSLLKFANEHRIAIAQVLQHEQSAWHYVLAWFDEAGRLNTFDPDICGDYFRHGRLFLKAEQVVSGRVRHNTVAKSDSAFFVPTPARGFIYYLLKKIDKGTLDERQGEYLSSQWKLDAQGGLTEIRRFWPDVEAGILARAAAASNWTLVRKEISKLRAVLRCSIRSTFRYRWNEVVRKWRRLIHPTGLLIVFLGSDGSGKSTIIKHVQNDVGSLFRRTQIYHLRPHFGCRQKDQGPVYEPHARSTRNMFTSLIKGLFYWADYTIGYWWAIWPNKVRSTLILFDRYFFDLVVDPRRLRYGGPRWISRVLARCIPSPDLTIYLHAPPEILLSRKQEVAASELERQHQEYSVLISKLGNGYKVDASKPLAEVIYNVETIIVDFLEARVSKRLTSDV
jgi:thymidylate kinase